MTVKYAATPVTPQLTFREKLVRHARLLPVNAIHTWKVASTPFKLLTLFAAAVSVLLLISELKVRDLSSVYLRATRAPQRAPRRALPCDAAAPCRVMMVADLDTRSLIPGPKPKYISKMVSGRFFFNNSEPHFEWDRDKAPLDVIGKLSEEGRGMELSELVLWNNRLLSFDDRTGVVYELMATLPGTNTVALPRLLESHSLALQKTIDAVPRYILSEEQDSGKGMKIEWACEKNGSLYIGSFGKEYTTRDGSQITGEANFWIVRVDSDGRRLERLNWKSQYQRLREITGTLYPGYLIHEAVNWSEIRKRWFFLPRRESKERYDEREDESRGTNLIIEIDDDFRDYRLQRVQFPEPKQPARGFSSFKFLPGTNDTLILAIRSEEDDQANILKTHASIINVEDGSVVQQEFEVSQEFKFEGIELW